MISRKTALLSLLVFLLAAVSTASARAEKTPVKPTSEIEGSADNVELLKEAPKFIASTADLEKLWKAWGWADKPPKVDFTKELVVLTTTRGSRLKLLVTLDETGNLEVGGIATRDLRPGFRYILGIVSREGVKTIGGKELPPTGP